ncbi:MAG: hypothetical protein ACR2HO_10315 [Rubrobacteraceae bacterium]
MKLSGHLRDVLGSAVEDYCGLWEVVWELNTQYLEISQHERYSAAKSIVRTLISQGWVDLYEDRGLGGRDLEPLRREAYEQTLSDQANWESPIPKSKAVWIGATDAGEEAYYQMAEYP